jgi:signal transduction histidine kinase/CheY-like chemotaxis protein
MTIIRLHHRLSIRQKIISIILTVTFLSIITGFAIEIASTIKVLRKELEDNISLDAKLISEYLTPTFLFNDPTGAKDILMKLTNIPTIIYGAAYESNGNKYAEYRSTAIHDTLIYNDLLIQPNINRNIIIVQEQIQSQNELLGKVILVASTDTIQKKANAHIKTIIIILIISILFASVLAFWLERIISGPILRLASLTRRVQETLDYSLRIKKESNDETGLLYDGFNDMLQSIEAKKIEKDIAQEKLEEEREHLEIRVKERTKELSAAKEKAEESDKLKSAFLANMSHEIRTPLNAILGCSSLIRESSATPAELEEYYKMIETGGNDLLKLIDDILDISLIEANQIKLNIKETSVKKLGDEVFKTFRQLLYNENPGVPVAPVFLEPGDETDYYMNTDPLRLKQILLNILNNAVKFTHEGSIEFCYFPNESKTHIIFYIKDTGIGIPKDQQEKIFERFTKAVDIKTKHYRGTGLGLSIALKLTQLLKGEIRLESEVNIGTAFYLTFPMIKAVAPVAVPDQKPKDQSLAFLSGKTILLVEDVEYNFRYFEIIFSRNNDIKLIWAKNGLEAVEFCKNNPEINCVLMDIQLPEMNGIDATRLIKERNSSLPVIAQTAYGTTTDIQSCLDAGCVEVLIKPIRKATLLDSLKKHMV